jgi:hypothetical protein
MKRLLGWKVTTQISTSHGSGCANDNTNVIPEETEVVNEINEKTNDVEKYDAEVDLSPQPHKPIIQSQSRQNDDIDLAGTLSLERMKTVLANRGCQYS